MAVMKWVAAMIFLENNNLMSALTVVVSCFFPAPPISRESVILTSVWVREGSQHTYASPQITCKVRLHSRRSILLEKLALASVKPPNRQQPSWANTIIPYYTP